MINIIIIIIIQFNSCFFHAHSTAQGHKVQRQGNLYHVSNDDGDKNNNN
jgi:hypothetical protein